MQATADVLDGLGLNAPDDNPFSPNAAILRSAEAVDSVLNSARSGFAETRRESGGMILCSMVQMGGIIYVAFMLIIALVLMQCLPLVNLLTRILFDLTVTLCTSAAGDGGAKKKAGKGLAGAIKAQVANQVKEAMAGTTGGAPRVPTGAAFVAIGGSWDDNVGKVRITGTDSNGDPIYSSHGHSSHNTELTTAKMRTVLRRRRTARKLPTYPKPVSTAMTSIVNDAYSFGKRVLGTHSVERVGLLMAQETEDGHAHI